MRKLAEIHFKDFIDLLGTIKATDVRGERQVLFGAIEMTCQLAKQSAANGRKMLFIGNGGSAAIAGHMAVDFWKNGGIKALAFNDSSLLTCIGNDCGYTQVFAKPIEMFAESGDVLFAVSSSGKSENILNAVMAARAKNCKVVTFSGFAADNPLCRLGDFNFYVPSNEYGPVEVAHQYLCHCILDVLLKDKNSIID
jgi:D-sedoheptulose 7-phosphate isomerase